MKPPQKSEWMIEGYKVFDVHPDSSCPQFIFHGLNKTRTVPFNKWLVADSKLVTDGSSATVYWSGFHIFPSEDAIKQWVRSVKNIDNRAVVLVKARQTWFKSHSKHDVVLASEMRVKENEWENKKPLRNYT